MNRTLREQYAQQIARLASLQFFPTEDIAVRELVAALINATGGDVNHATRTISLILATIHSDERRFPTPADFAEFASDVASTGMTPPSGDCAECGGTGFSHGKKIVRGVAYDCSAVCACRKTAVSA